MSNNGYIAKKYRYVKKYLKLLQMFWTIASVKKKQMRIYIQKNLLYKF